MMKWVGQGNVFSGGVSVSFTVIKENHKYNYINNDSPAGYNLNQVCTSSTSTFNLLMTIEFNDIPLLLEAVTPYLEPVTY